MPSMPPFSGITRSIRTTSGFPSSASNTARSALGASPTVSMSVLGIEEAPEPGTDDGVVVDDENADHWIGTSAVSIVPAPSVDSIVRLPPRSAMRSRMPTEADAPVAHVVGIEALSVVLDDERHAAPGPTQVHPHEAARLRVSRTFVMASCVIR